MARSLFSINLASIIGEDSAIAVDVPLYFYEQDGVTLATTYTTAAGSTENTNPMLTQGDGRFAQQAWLEPGTYVYSLEPPGEAAVSGQFIAIGGPGDIDPALDDFLSGVAPLPVASGGTGSTNAPDALVALGAFPSEGGTVTGNITLATRGAFHYWDSAPMTNAGWFLTVDSDPDPTNEAGEVWLKYSA